MRLLLIIVGAFAAIVCIERPAEARDYPWCAYYNFRHGGGATNCGWETFEQCLATVKGIGGSCGANPMYQTAPAPYPSTGHPRRYSY
jgi:hypothetical protein